MSRNIQHITPSLHRRRRKRAARLERIGAGFLWDGRRYQIDDLSRQLILGRVGQINAQISLGRLDLDGSSYVDRSGVVRPLTWTAGDNQPVSFTAREFLEFGAAVAEYIDDIYDETV